MLDLLVAKPKVLLQHSLIPTSMEIWNSSKVRLCVPTYVDEEDRKGIFAM
ncbi:MAG TPA: hypothetical protein VJP58_06240 [Candidatus Nitrosocosmicus sp.]|nr:hypothetical protein [Candidatus Nitrosocosmicus sp.]